MVLTLSAVKIGDRLPFNQEIVDIVTDHCDEDGTLIEVFTNFGVTMGGRPDTTITVEDVVLTLDFDRLLATL